MVIEVHRRIPTHPAKARAGKAVWEGQPVWEGRHAAGPHRGREGGRETPSLALNKFSE